MKRCCVALILLMIPWAARSQDSPCNQGRAVWPRVDPRYDWLICVPEIGMRLLRSCCILKDVLTFKEMMCLSHTI